MHIFLGYIYCSDQNGTSYLKECMRRKLDPRSDTSRLHNSLYIPIMENSLLSEYTFQVTKRNKRRKKENALCCKSVH